MRPGNNNRRSRGRGNRRPTPGGRFQTFDSNGPTGRLRGNANQLYEKYLMLGRDAAGSGDRVTAENLFQHADHYFRILSANGDGAPKPRVNGDGDHSDGFAYEGRSHGSDEADEDSAPGEERGQRTAEASDNGKQPAEAKGETEAAQETQPAEPAEQATEEKPKRTRRRRTPRATENAAEDAAAGDDQPPA